MKVKSLPVFFKQSATVEGNIIKDIVIVAGGKDKVGDYFTQEFLAELVKQGNSGEIGIKSRYGHPNMCKDGLGTYLGRYKNFRLNDDYVIADLHLSESAKDTPSGNLYDYIIRMASTEPEAIGNSIVFTGESESKDVEGEMLNVLNLKTFMFSDIVDSPAATHSLFQAKDAGVAIGEMLDEYPEVIETLAKSPSIIVEFLEKRYLPRIKSENQNLYMGFLDEIKKSLGLKNQVEKNIMLPLEGGGEVEVVTDAEEPAVGDSVLVDGAPAPDADHVLADGTVVTTVGGIITAIVPKVVDPAPAPSPEVAVIAEEVKSLTTKLSSIEKSLANVAELQKSITELQSAVQLIAKATKSNYVTPVAGTAAPANTQRTGTKRTNN